MTTRKTRLQEAAKQVAIVADESRGDAPSVAGYLDGVQEDIDTAVEDLQDATEVEE